MKAIVNTGPNVVEWRDWPMPQPGPGQVRIKTAACCVCATDLVMIAGWDRTGFPAIPGHEWSGVVEAVGEGGDRKLIGQPCVGYNVLADGGEVGFEHPGGYAEYLVTEARNLFLLPSDFPLTRAAMIEPLAVCVRGVKRLRLEDLSSALLLGDGPVGLLMLLLLKAHGVKRLVVVGGRQGRLAVARELGVELTLNYHEIEGDLGQAILKQSKPFANVIDASGSHRAMAAAVDVTPVGGKVLVMGDYRQHRVDVPWQHIVYRELEIIGSNASAGGWPEAVKLATEGAVPLEKLISRTLPAARFAEALALARESREVIKVVMEWN